MCGRAAILPVMPLPPLSTDRIRIGVSSCLIGERVRYDGGDKRDGFIVDSLGAAFELVPVCPEVAIGMGVPRPPIRLVGDLQQPRALGVDDPDLDVSAPLTAFGRRMAVELDDIDAYIFKSRSPSCGPARVKVYGAGKVPRAQGVGLYAREIMARQPLLPVEEEGRLVEPLRRDNFIERVFAYRRWKQLLASGFSTAGLMEFHARHKLILMAHGAVYYRALGRLAAEGKGLRPARLCEEYGIGFTAALQHPATRKRHANVLQHLMGYLKKHIDQDDKAELLEVIDAYHLGVLPLIAPQTLLRHHFRRFPNAYVEKQLYLYPDSLELQLRSNT
jgi:uncharacterized protein YbgA (DUF1722 family)/uncharacterized protein YbbK (DUF523 family)